MTRRPGRSIRLNLRQMYLILLASSSQTGSISAINTSVLSVTLRRNGEHHCLMNEDCGYATLSALAGMARRSDPLFTEDRGVFTLTDLGRRAIEDREDLTDELVARCAARRERERQEQDRELEEASSFFGADRHS